MDRVPGPEGHLGLRRRFVFVGLMVITCCVVSQIRGNPCDTNIWQACSKYVIRDRIKCSKRIPKRMYVYVCVSSVLPNGWAYETSCFWAQAVIIDRCRISADVTCKQERGKRKTWEWEIWDRLKDHLKFI